MHSTPWGIDSLVLTATTPFAGLGKTGDEAARLFPGVLLACDIHPSMAVVRLQLEHAVQSTQANDLA